MCFYKRRRRRFCCKIIALVSLVVLIVHIFVVNHVIHIDVEPKTNLCEFMKVQNDKTIKYIFNLDHWRELMGNIRILKDNQTLWCNIPDELQLISNAICRLYRRDNCTHLPCQMIYSSSKTLEYLSCTHGGQILRRNNNDNLTQNQSDFVCKIGYSLDLFANKSNDSSYPSIIGDALSPLLNDLYVNVLNNHFRSCDSMWGFRFNFESISNYPWTSDPKQLKLFDVTFGYDRSIYDFIPAPWLFNYVEQIKFTPRRMSMKKAMDNKKPIYSTTKSDIYWTNNPSFVTREETISTSYVRAPIMWMNSNCYTKSRRTEYMRYLMKYIDVDNYGNCGNNIRTLPEHIIQIQGSKNRSLKDRYTYDWEAGKFALSSDYLFTIAIENSRNYDYVTEKLWHPFVAGSVPIYLGAPNIDDWLPCQSNCIIDLSKFQTPRDAAKYLKTVAMNRTLYESYHQWRNEPVSQKFQNMIDYYKKLNKYSLECILCDMSKRVSQGEDSKEIKKKLLTTIGRF